MRLQHVVESQQFTVPLLMDLFDRTRRMERVVARGGTLDYQHRILASLFYAPSMRTRFSFESAMYRLGGHVLSTEQARAFSSEIEGEQVEDSVRIIGHYADVIVIRHSEEGGARRAAEVSPVPIMNAGDGTGGQHPTQALLDLYTIYRARPIDGLSIALELLRLHPRLQVAVSAGVELSADEAALCERQDFPVLRKPFLPEDIVAFVRSRLLRAASAGAR
jgi:aspartate carbamoyltransferase catalytic subunit